MQTAFGGSVNPFVETLAAAAAVPSAFKKRRRFKPDSKADISSSVGADIKFTSSARPA
jgi:hypothetical protein